MYFMYFFAMANHTRLSPLPTKFLSYFNNVYAHKLLKIITNHHIHILYLYISTHIVNEK